jgi:MoaA/NifB/PqqE/SkfB family radical SAM enzyme
MYCKQGIIGAQFSHPQRGHGLCCASMERYHGSPKEIWYKKLDNARLNIANNKKVKNCISCYVCEEKGVKSFRQIYNEQFKNYIPTELPQHLDLDFSNFCNLKCIMCGPDRSSMWAKEKGLYPDNNGVTAVSSKELEEICELSYDLKHITLQGGEPTMIKEYQNYFQFLKDNNIIQNVSLNVVTNLTNLNEKFFFYLPYFKRVNISVSVDAFGTANDYIRYPSNFKKITDNIKMLNQYDLDCTIDTAIQILSMYDIKNFIDWFKNLEIHFQKNKKTIRRYFQQVWEPECLNINNAPQLLKEEFIKSVKNTDLEYLTGFFTKNSYNYQKTIDFFKNIDHKRNISVVDYVPKLGSYYQI